MGDNCHIRVGTALQVAGSHRLPVDLAHLAHSLVHVVTLPEQQRLGETALYGCRTTSGDIVLLPHASFTTIVHARVVAEPQITKEFDIFPSMMSRAVSTTSTTPDNMTIVTCKTVNSHSFDFIDVPVKSATRHAPLVSPRCYSFAVVPGMRCLKIQCTQ